MKVDVFFPHCEWANPNNTNITNTWHVHFVKIPKKQSKKSRLWDRDLIRLSRHPTGSIPLYPLSLSDAAAQQIGRLLHRRFHTAKKHGERDPIHRITICKCKIRQAMKSCFHWRLRFHDHLSTLVCNCWCIRRAIKNQSLNHTSCR